MSSRNEESAPSRRDRSRSKERKSPHKEHKHGKKERSRSRSTERKKKNHHDEERDRERHHRSRRHSRSRSRSPARADATIRWSAAEEVLRGLINASPGVASELQVVLEMLDRGEGVSVQGIGDPLLKAGLSLLLSTVDAQQRGGSDGDGACFLPRHVRKAGLVRHLGPVLTAGAGSAAVGAASAAGAQPAAEAADNIDGHSRSFDSAAVAHAGRTIGPARPPVGFDPTAGPSTAQPEQAQDEDEEDDDVGPLPAYDPRARRPDPAHVAAAAAAARGGDTEGGDDGDEGNNGGGPRRDAWMNIGKEGGFGSIGEGSKGSVRTATKAAPRAGIGWAYLKKTEGAGKEDASGADTAAAVSGSGAGPKSLTELYQQQRGLAASGGGSGVVASSKPAERRPFDRERDLQIPRQLNTDAVVARAAGLHSRFSHGRG